MTAELDKDGASGVKWDLPGKRDLSAERADEAMALREMRERKGISIEELAELAEVPLLVLVQLEDPNQQTTLLDHDTLMRIVQALDADFTQIPHIRS